MLIDDLTIILSVLSLTRFFAFLIFLERAIKSREVRNIVLAAGWLIYSLGPVFALYNYMSSGTADHFLFGLFAVISTFLLTCALILYYYNLRLLMLLRIFLGFSILFVILYLLFPRHRSYLAVFSQLLLIVSTMIIVFFRRKWILEAGGRTSYLWITGFFIFSLISIAVHLTIKTIPLSVKFVLTYITNVTFMLTFVHFNREQAFRQIRNSRRDIMQSLDEKEVLLKEIHHRVKNNLTIMSSLLNLQSSAIGDSGALDQLTKAQNRIDTMALIHEKLYESPSLARVNFREYIETLVHHLIGVSGVETNAILEIDEFELGPDILIPCGLIVNEVITNSLQYAFLNTPAAEISVSAGIHDSCNIVIVIEDNGTGFPDDFDPLESSGLGFFLIHNLLIQLGGRMDIRDNSGVTLEFTIPLKEAETAEVSAGKPDN